MTVVGITMVRDEADVIETTIRHMLGQVDRLIVADNLSQDGTRDILERLAREAPDGALSIRDDPEPGYLQSQKMSALAEEAHGTGAAWVVPFDADELWYGKRGTVRRTLEALPDWIHVAEATLYDYVATSRDNGAPSPMQAMRWRRRDPAPLPKVAARAMAGMVIHQGNHGVTLPGHPVPPIIKHLLTVRHFPYRTAEQMIRKARNGAAAYAATDLPEAVGGHWRGYGRMTDQQITETFFKWFHRSEPDQAVEIDGESQPPLVEDPIRLEAR